jgi:hypothetical protein
MAARAQHGLSEFAWGSDRASERGIRSGSLFRSSRAAGRRLLARAACTPAHKRTGSVWVAHGVTGCSHSECSSDKRCVRLHRTCSMKHGSSSTACSVDRAGHGHLHDCSVDQRYGTHSVQGREHGTEINQGACQRAGSTKSCAHRERMTPMTPQWQHIRQRGRKEARGSQSAQRAWKRRCAAATSECACS